MVVPYHLRKKQTLGVGKAVQKKKSKATPGTPTNQTQTVWPGVSNNKTSNTRIRRAGLILFFSLQPQAGLHNQQLHEKKKTNTFAFDRQCAFDLGLRPFFFTAALLLPEAPHKNDHQTVARVSQKAYIQCQSVGPIREPPRAPVNRRTMHESESAAHMYEEKIGVVVPLY